MTDDEAHDDEAHDDEVHDDEAHDSDDGPRGAHPLLQVQQLDTEAEQIQHRRANLSQRQGLSAARAEQGQLQRQIDTVALQRIEVLTRQKRLEDEAAIIQAKADVDDNRLYSGELTAIRDLQALQQEITSLRAHQGMLEERAIEAMVEAEELSEQAESLGEQRRNCDERATVLEAELASAEAAIDEQLAALSTKRDDAAASAEADAVSKYERIREMFGPSTAVPFDPSSGCGCPNQMPAVEVARIKRCAEGEVLDCAECGRLVLR